MIKSVKNAKNLKKESTKLYSDIKLLIEQSRQNVAAAVNAAISILYWNIGIRINKEILKDSRAQYGKRTIIDLSRKLETEYGESFSEKNIRRMIQFAKVFPDERIVVSLIRQLSWTHIIAILPIEESLKREFYIQMGIHEKWSVRTLRERIQSMLFERTAISKKPQETIKQDLALLKNEKKLSPDLVFRDPYFLGFLGLSDKYSEKDVETAILAELQNFIVEFGSDFAFLSRQKRITIDNEDYYIDLLFYHRRLKSLVVIELKIGNFKAEYKGQMELYLRYLEKYEVREGENAPIGLILCTGKNKEHIELLQLDKSNIKVAQYLLKPLEQKMLVKKFRKAVEIAQAKLAGRS
ncbi:MAG: PDDEXK nuclease domain-containing protein [Endomicrobia bacterium]|nr:PDDEXK nuclease domain-containing protein [Endomicrobiia bacterium]